MADGLIFYINDKVETDKITLNKINCLDEEISAEEANCWANSMTNCSK